MPVTTPNPQVPDPHAIPGYVDQQVPSPPQVEGLQHEAMQPAMQQSWGQMPADAGMQAGFAQAVPAAYGPAVSARSHKSYIPAGILFGIGLLLALVPVVGWDLIGSFNSGGRIYTLTELFIFLLLIGIILILISGIMAIVVAVVNSSPQK